MLLTLGTDLVGFFFGQCLFDYRCLAVAVQLHLVNVKQNNYLAY